VKIGTVADRLGIPASTIRYYERIGLIDRQRRVAGRREFDQQALFALKFVQLAQAAGFSIAEAKRLLESHADNPGPDGLWHPFADAKRKVVRQQIKDLERMDDILTALLSCKCSTLSECVEACGDLRQTTRKRRRKNVRR
jgi:DNA-binding transcriptional MerR regulator